MAIVNAEVKTARKALEQAQKRHVAAHVKHMGAIKAASETAKSLEEAHIAAQRAQEALNAATNGNGAPAPAPVAAAAE